MANDEEIPFLRKRQDIPANQFSLVFPDLDKMGLDREAVVAAAVFPGHGSPVKIRDPVLLPALFLKIPGRDNAHRRDTSETGFILSKILYLHVSCMSMKEMHHIYCVFGQNGV